MLISPSRLRIPTIDFRINLDGAEMKFVKANSLARDHYRCLDDRGLEINSGKTVAMLISPSRLRIPTIDFRINLDGAEMKLVKSNSLARDHYR